MTVLARSPRPEGRVELTADEEGRTPAYAAMIGGRSLRVEAAVDCRAGAVFVHHLVVHAGPDLTGPVVTEFDGTGWRPVAPRSTAARLLTAGCGARALLALKRTPPATPPSRAVVAVAAAALAVPPPVVVARAPEAPAGVRLRPTLAAVGPDAQAGPVAVARTAATPVVAGQAGAVPVAVAPTMAPDGAAPAVVALQVSAADTQAQAQGLISRLPARFPGLGALRPRVEPAVVNGRHVFRALFLAPERRAAAILCKRLADAGQACFLRPAPAVDSAAEGVTRPG